MSPLSLRARSIGEILDGAFRLYRHDLGLYAFTAAVAALPMTLATILSFTGGESVTAAVLALILFLVAFVAALMVWAALLHQMNHRLNGRDPSLRWSMRRALRLAPRVAWGGILAYVLFVVAVVVAGGAAAVVGAVLLAVLGEGTGSVLGVILGILILFPVMLGLMAGLSLFLPVAVVEDQSAYQSIKRGLALSKGGRLRIITVLGIVWILLFIPLMAVYFLTGTSQMMLDPEAFAAGTVSTGQVVVQQVLVLMTSAITTPMVVASILLLYYDQRVRREAFDLEAEAAALSGR